MQTIPFKVYNDDETAVLWNVNKGVFSDLREGLNN